MRPGRSHDLAQDLAQGAGRGDDLSVVTMTRIAEVAQVSLSTVSHVLNRTRPVSDATRAAVLQAADELGYEDPRVALANTRDVTVGAVVPAAASPYFGELIEGMSAEAVRLDVDLLIMTSGEDPDLERRALESLISRRVDGIVLIPSGRWQQRSRPALLRHETPFVLVDRLVDSARYDQVGCENEHASEMIVSHLIKLGHRRIALIRGLAGLPTTNEREAGYRNALDRSGIQVDERLIVDGQSTVRGGRLAMERLLTAHPTAVFCANNNMTMGALATLRRLHIQIPDDLALVAFDDLEWSDIIEPGITSLAQPFHAMGNQALQLLLDRLESPDSPAQTVRLPPSFEHRQSCGCP
jgi:LacI family transcriptional regulator